jgi:hypothetical protein
MRGDEQRLLQLRRGSPAPAAPLPPPPSPPSPFAAAGPLFRATSLEGVLRRVQAMGLVGDRAWRFRTYRRCLRGRDLVDFLCATGQCPGRASAVELGQALIDHGLLAGGARFEDAAEAHYEVEQQRGGGRPSDSDRPSFAGAIPPLGAPTPLGAASSAAAALQRHDTALSAFSGADDEHVSVSARGGSELGDGEAPPGSDVAAEAVAAAAGAAAGAPLSPPPRGAAGGLPPLAPPSGFAGFVARVSRSFSAIGRFRSASLSEVGGEGEARGEPRPRGGSSSAGSGSGDFLAERGGPAAAAARARELEATLWFAGWLRKRGHVRKGFKRRWFVLRGFQLAYYRAGPRDEGAAAAIAAAAVAAAVAVSQKGGGGGGGGGGEQVPPQPAAALPQSGEEPAGVLDIRGFSAEAAAMERSLLALRLVSKTRELEYVVCAEREADFVNWVKALTLCRAAWEKV